CEGCTLCARPINARHRQRHTCNGTDYYGIYEYLGHGYQCLTCRDVRTGGGCGDTTGAETGFVGKQPAGHTHAYYSTKCPSGSRLTCKCIRKDYSESSRHLINMSDKNCNTRN